MVMGRGATERVSEVVRELGEGRWGLVRARAAAREVEGAERSKGTKRSKGAVRALVGAMFGTEAEVRKRAADVARRVTERSAEPMWEYADELAGLLAEMPVEESRTRWHLGLVVARVAHTREQRLRAARLMELLAADESNVVRCSAVEGIAMLACDEASLREVAQTMVERAMREGTAAERCRAREGRRRLERAGILRVEL